MNTLSIYINDELAYEYDRTTTLNDQQQEFLDKMDADMARGLKVGGELISAPDTRQRATFVALNLIKGLQQEDEARIAVACAYLSSRMPHVVETHARDQGDRVAIEFVEEH